MSCLRIDLETILNIFGGHPIFFNEFPNGIVKKEIIEKCAIYLINNLPGYVYCDISGDEIKKAIKDNDRISYHEEKEIFIYKKLKNRNYYVSSYSKSIGEKIISLIDYFLKEKLYEKEIVLLKRVY